MADRNGVTLRALGPRKEASAELRPNVGKGSRMGRGSTRGRKTTFPEKGKGKRCGRFLPSNQNESHRGRCMEEKGKGSQKSRFRYKM